MKVCFFSYDIFNYKLTNHYLKKFIFKDVCLLEEPEKSCYNYTLKWRYDAKEGRCIQFWFDGCNSNGNLFNTNEECEGKCVKPNGTSMNFIIYLFL